MAATSRSPIASPSSTAAEHVPTTGTSSMAVDATNGDSRRKAANQVR